MNPEMAAMFAAMSAAAAAAPSQSLASIGTTAGAGTDGDRPPVLAPPLPYDVLTPLQAAEYLQVSEQAVLAEAEAGRLPGKRIGGHWRFLRLAITEWLRSAARPATLSRPPAGVGAAYADEDPEAVIAALYAERKKNPVGG